MVRIDKYKKWIVYIVLIVLILFLWQHFGKTNQTIRLLISSPLLVIEYFGQNYIELIHASVTTFIEASAGLLIAVIFSFGVMIICFYFPKLMEYILPIMITSQVIPLIVLAPFFIILLGIGLGSKIAMASIMCFFPIFVNFSQGYKMIKQNIHDLMYIYNADKLTRIRLVYFPLSMPSIIAGLKISATLSVIGAIVAEFAGAEIGLGRNLYISAIRLEPEMMMSSLILSAFLGILFFGTISLIEKQIKWIRND
jgi:NitT/TauT family transport system permease protein